MGGPANFGGYLRHIRKGKGFTQRQLAAATGLDYTYISKLENNRLEHTASEELCEKIAIVLGEDPWEVMRFAGKIPTELKRRLLGMPVARWRVL